MQKYQTTSVLIVVFIGGSWGREEEGKKQNSKNL